MSIFSAVSTTIPTFAQSETPLPVIQGGSVASTSQGGASSVFLSSGTGLGLASFVGVFLDFLAVMIVVSLIGVVVIAVVANRADPDPTGRRPQSVYYFVVSFVTLGIAIVGSATVVTGVDILVGNHSNAVSNSAAKAILLGGLTALVSMFLLVAQLRRGLDLARTDAQAPSPSRRVGQSYAATVAFVSVVSLLVLFVLSVYLVSAIAVPGVFGSVGSQSGVAHVLVVAVYLLIASAVVWETHRKLVFPELNSSGAFRNPARLKDDEASGG